ncbi:MAG: putative membrane protein, partial [Bacteroidia bacterium]
MNENAWSWVLQLLGRLHPLVVHFPIGLLVVALFME